MQVQNANVSEQATVENVNTFPQGIVNDGVNSPIQPGAATTEQSTEVNGTGQDGVVSVEEFERLRSTNQRLLEESKKYKSRMQKAEEEKLLAENNKDEIIRRQKEKLEEIDNRLMAKAISEAVSKEAMKRNCRHWDHLLNVGDTSLLEYDPETESVSGVKDFFDKHENDEDYSIYFKKVEPVTTVNNTQTVQTSTIDYKSDPIGYLRNVKKNSPEKFDNEVRRMQNEGLIN